MATITKRVLSASIDGQPVGISATAAKVVHTGSSLTNVLDEVYMWAQCSSTADVSINVEIGASASHAFGVTVLAKGEGAQVILPGIPIQGAATPIAISVQASSSGVINIIGFVNRISQ